MSRVVCTGSYTKPAKGEVLAWNETQRTGFCTVCDLHVAAENGSGVWLVAAHYPPETSTE